MTRMIIHYLLGEDPFFFVEKARRYIVLLMLNIGINDKLNGLD